MVFYLKFAALPQAGDQTRAAEYPLKTADSTDDCHATSRKRLLAALIDD